MPTPCNKMSKLAHYRHISYTLALTCANDHAIIFCTFLDIRKNDEWPATFLAHVVQNI